MTWPVLHDVKVVGRLGRGGGRIGHGATVALHGADRPRWTPRGTPWVVSPGRATGEPVCGVSRSLVHARTRRAPGRACCELHECPCP